MEITRVTAHALSSPIEPMQERQFYGGVRRLHKRDMVVVVIRTTDGLKGVAPAGASSSAMKEYYEGASQATFAKAIESEVADVLEGEDIEHTGELAAAISRTNLPNQLQMEATSALDVAFYDLKGKRVGESVASLLAEEYNESVEPEMALYASAGMYMDPEGYAEQAAILEANQFRGYKYRPGIGPAGDRAIVELLAETLETCAFMPDAHTWWKVPGDTYDRQTVRHLVQHAGAHGATWVEEPVEPSDYDGYRDLASLDVPLAGGESETSPDGLIALGNTRAIRYLQGDVRHHGGYTGCWRAAEETADLPLWFVPHHFGTWLGLIANAHLVAALPESNLLEYPIFERDPLIDGEHDPGMYPFELAFEIIEEEPQIEDGVLTVPDGDGLGITFDDRVLGSYRYQDGPWTEFLTKSGAE